MIAIHGAIALPDDVKAILDQAPYKATGAIANGGTATWYYWPYGKHEVWVYNPVHDFLNEMQDEHYALIEVGDDDYIEKDGNLDIFRIMDTAGIESPWTEVFDRQRRARELNPAFQTEVKAEWFKTDGSGKSYVSETFFTVLGCWNGPEITNEVKLKYPHYCQNYHYTIEVWQIDGHAWNKYLKLSEGHIELLPENFSKPKKIHVVKDIAKPERVFENVLLDQNFEANYAGPKDELLAELPYYSRPNNCVFKYLFTEVEDYFALPRETQAGETRLTDDGKLVETRTANGAMAIKRVVAEFDLDKAPLSTIMILLNDIESDLWRIINEPALEDEYKDQLIDNVQDKYHVLKRRYLK